MNEFFYKVYRIVVPKFIRKKIRLKILRTEILAYYSKSSSPLSDELNIVLDFLKTNPVSIFPYPFQHKYNKKEIEVFWDENKKLRYVLLDGHRLYFKKRWSEKRIRHSFNELKRGTGPAKPPSLLKYRFPG